MIQVITGIQRDREHVGGPAIDPSSTLFPPEPLSVR